MRVRIVALVVVGACWCCSSAQAAGTCQPYWAPVASPITASNAKIAANADDDVWVAEQEPVWDGSSWGNRIAHWDGTAWSDILLEEPFEREYFTALAIDGTSSTDMWLAGAVSTEAGPEAAGILHWNGVDWEVSHTHFAGAIFDLKVISPDDVWAVGKDGEGRLSEPAVPLLLHWDGTDWSQESYPLPPPNGGDDGGAFPSAIFYAVDATSANDVWAVGMSPDRQAVIDHFDGTSWTNLAPPQAHEFPLPFTDVAAVSPGNAWFVARRDSDPTRGLAHWDGDSWSTPVTPAVPRRLAAVSSGDVWGAGASYNGGVANATMRFDGRSWKVFATPSLTDPQALTVLPNGHLWAAGPTARICPVSVGETALSPPAVTLTQGLPVAWHFEQANVASHTLLDGTGLALFNPGPREPGAGYQASFNAAGRYAVIDATTGLRQTVSVLLKATPTSGSITTPFTIRWLSGTAPASRSFDVQLKRPAATGWTDWIVGTTERSAVFAADAGAGEYAFRSRMRNAGTGAATNWSIPKLITVR